MREPVALGTVAGGHPQADVLAGARVGQKLNIRLKPEVAVGGFVEQRRQRFECDQRGQGCARIIARHGERNRYAQTMFAQHPELFPEDRRQSILDGVVLIGMTPFEARLAGGAFAYKVVADPLRWPTNADPYKVMWAQSMLPDKSEIWMIFKNSTQFPGEGECRFRVYFEQGCASKIELLKD